jgi:hypothetical protein
MLKVNCNHSVSRIVLRGKGKMTESPFRSSQMVRGAYLVRPAACPASHVGVVDNCITVDSTLAGCASLWQTGQEDLLQLSKSALPRGCHLLTIFTPASSMGPPAAQTAIKNKDNEGCVTSRDEPDSASWRLNALASYVNHCFALNRQLDCGWSGLLRY